MAGGRKPPADGSGDGRKIVADNRKARHDFHVIEVFQAGLSLQGTEVKSLREGGGNIREAYVVVRGSEAFITGMHIAPYVQGNIHNHEPTRERRLLLHKREIEQLKVHTTQKGNTIVPLNVHFQRGRAKLDVGVARGKQSIDKRRAIADRDVKRQVEREMKERTR